MKIVKTAEFEKLSYSSEDDQPNFVNRDQKGQGNTIYVNPMPCSVQEIEDEWVQPKRSKKSKKRSPKIEEMPKESL